MSFVNFLQIVYCSIARMNYKDQNPKEILSFCFESTLYLIFKQKSWNTLHQSTCVPTFLCGLACDDEEALISEHLPPAPLLRAEAGPRASERSKEQAAPGIMGTPRPLAG